MSRHAKTRHPVRNAIVLLFFLSGLVLLAARAVYLQVLNSDFLQSQGNQRHTRLVKDNSHRGMILDRHGSPLAVSAGGFGVGTSADPRGGTPEMAAAGGAAGDEPARTHAASAPA